ncbi:MAG: hypothetical protein BGO98_16900 [Myxococcales bacterium 68-20]|nr:MAG: hypothetical protein BGO98_16900 [Myxococcales bacterium 68-20]
MSIWPACVCPESTSGAPVLAIVGAVRGSCVRTRARPGVLTRAKASSTSSFLLRPSSTPTTASARRKPLSSDS